MKGSLKHHRNITGSYSIIDTDSELKNFVLEKFLSGSNPTEIAKAIEIRWPTKKISRLTISRYLDKSISNLSPDEYTSEKVTKEVNDAFSKTTENFRKLFNEMREEIALTPKQEEMLDKTERKVNLEISLAKRRFRIYQLQFQITDSQIQNILRKFTNSLTGEQRRTLGEMVEKELFTKDQLLGNVDSRKYEKWKKKQTKSFYRTFGKEEGVEVQ